MKKQKAIIAYLVGLLLLLVTAASAQTTEKLWLSNYEQAAKKAKAENKPILMVFAGSDWCKPCIMLRKEVWDTDAFMNYAKDNFVLLELDFPRFKKNQLPEEQVKHNEALAEKYNTEGTFPLVVVTDADGKVLAKTGYQPGGPQNYIQHLQTLMKK